MWISLCLVTVIWVSKTQAEVQYCESALNDCKDSVLWTTCYESKLRSCTNKGRSFSFFQRIVNSSQEAKAGLFGDSYTVNIPSTALQKSRGASSEEMVQLVATVINSTFFQLSPDLGIRRGRGRSIAQPSRMSGTVMGQSVLVVKAGKFSVTNLLQPVKLTFKNVMQVKHGTCVFWQDAGLLNATGYWSPDGCNTSNTGTEYICSCDHLSFFAILVNPELSVEKSHAVTLSYITYIGSALSVFFTAISFIIYICLLLRRPEKAIGVHIQLTGALLCLHLSFLLCSHWVLLLTVDEEDWICKGLGLWLHWSLLATFSWTALEGFHIYLLLVRVFNIYVRRYMLKISLVGWGLPTLTVVICGILGVYGKYNLELSDGNDDISTAQICWMSSQFSQRLLVSYITTVALPGLVILSNVCMLGLVVFKLWEVKKGRGSGSSSSCKNLSKGKGTRLWKDCATVLGLSCVLGLPWGLASTTYISLPGIYAFTVLNSLQGVFIFLWSLALHRKARSDNNSSFKDQSSQKVMTTSFNN